MPPKKSKSRLSGSPKSKPTRLSISPEICYHEVAAKEEDTGNYFCMLCDKKLGKMK